MDLRGKKIVIIGGSSGLGLATAQAAARQGASVVIAGRSPERLARARAAIGGEVEARPLDVTQEEAVREFFGAVGALDHLATPGSAVKAGPFLTTAVASVRADFDSKFWGQYLAARYAAPHLRPGGSIVLFAGIYSQRPPAGGSAFAAINSAIEGLARGLAVELAPIRVNAVSPGLVDTPIYASLGENERRTIFAAYAAAAPAGHVGRPEEVAQTVLYLMTNTFTTGSTLYVDGGYTLR